MGKVEVILSDAMSLTDDVRPLNLLIRLILLRIKLTCTQEFLEIKIKSIILSSV